MAEKTLRQNVFGASELSFGWLLAEYATSLEAMNRSPKTISWYLEILGRYFAFLTSQQLLKPVEELGSRELRAYVLHLQRSDRWPNRPHIRRPTGRLSPHSIQGHARGVKAFWGWLEKEGHIEHNPLARFPLPKAPEKPVTVLSGEQIAGLLAGIDRTTCTGAKYYVILLLLLDTGMRISELTHITMEDMDLQQSCVQVLGKGRKLRSVPMSATTRREVLRYINHTRPTVCSAGTPYLFATPTGSPISVNGVQQFLRRLAGKAGLQGLKCSPHIFRHTFATQSVANEANVFALKAIMGHATLQMTMRYTHLQPEDLRIQHAKFSPVANLGIGKAGRKGRGAR